MSIPYIPVRQTPVNGSGTPYASATRTFYRAGTTTLLNAYADNARTTPLANPQVADSAGRFTAAYLDPTYDYRVVLKDAAGNTLADDDYVPSSMPVTAASIGAALYPRTAAETTAGVTPSNLSYPPGDVRRYGATGDGSTDDTSAILAALGQCNANGASVVFQEKTYLLGSWAAYSNTAAIRIEGNGATLKGPSSTVDFLSPAANFDIRNVIFDRWNSVVERLLAGTGSFTAINYIGNKHLNCNGQVFNLERPFANVRIDRCEFDTCTGGYAIKLGENTYANQSGYNKVWITNNKFKSLSAGSTTSCAAILAYGVDYVIDGNDVDGVSQTGTGEAWGIYTKVIGGRVTNNAVKTVDAAGSSDVAGINIKGTTRLVTSSPQGYSNVVSGNHVKAIGSAGAHGTGLRAQCDDVLIYGNTAEDCGANGISTDESTTHRNVRIHNNLVRFASNVSGTVGIRMEGSGTGIVAESNSVLNAYTGIRLTTGGTSSTMTSGQIVGNTVAGATIGIVIDSFSGCTLDRPVVERNVVCDGTYGLIWNGSAGTIQNAQIKFNDLVRATTPASGPFGTTPTVVGNFGYLTASATWNPASIANGASAATTVSVTGAALGDRARASFSLDLAGLALSAQVSAADTVEVRLLNNSGGSVDLASGTVRVMVEKGGW